MTKLKVMKNTDNKQAGFIPMMLFFLALLIAGVILVYLRVMRANQ